MRLNSLTSKNIKACVKYIKKRLNPVYISSNKLYKDLTPLQKSKISETEHNIKRKQKIIINI